jgi:hypothetical protein
MKLLTQSDDYGFTRGVTLGIIDAIENGIVRNTGMFVNMPESEHAAKLMKDRPQVCLGIDFNIVSGNPVTNPELLPDLVNEDGSFIRSTVKYADPRFGKEELWPYDQVMIELRGQLERFRELNGKDPEYLHGHSISRVSKAYVQAIRDLAAETKIPYSMDCQKKVDMSWAIWGYNVKPFSVENQIKTDVLAFAEQHIDECLGKEYVTLGGHAGFVDADLLKYSTYTIIRAKDHELFTSEFIKEWIRKNNVELITYRDIKNL